MSHNKYKKIRCSKRIRKIYTINVNHFRKTENNHGTSKCFLRYKFTLKLLDDLSNVSMWICNTIKKRCVGMRWFRFQSFEVCVHFERKISFFLASWSFTWSTLLASIFRSFFDVINNIVTFDHSIVSFFHLTLFFLFFFCRFNFFRNTNPV